MFSERTHQIMRSHNCFVMILVLLMASRSFADPIPGLFNTGVDGSGVALRDAAVDPHYILTTVPPDSGLGPNAYAMTHLNSMWMPNQTNPDSRWIGPAVLGVTHPSGNYVY